MYSGCVSAKLKLKCPVRAKLKCPNYPSEDEVREAEIGLGDDERTRSKADRSIGGSAGRRAYGGVGSWGLSAGCAADLSIVGEV